MLLCVSRYNENETMLKTLRRNVFRMPITKCMWNENRNIKGSILTSFGSRYQFSLNRLILMLAGGYHWLWCAKDVRANHFTFLFSFHTCFLWAYDERLFSMFSAQFHLQLYRLTHRSMKTYFTQDGKHKSGEPFRFPLRTVKRSLMAQLGVGPLSL